MKFSKYVRRTKTNSKKKRFNLKEYIECPKIILETYVQAQNINEYIKIYMIIGRDNFLTYSANKQGFIDLYVRDSFEIYSLMQTQLTLFGKTAQMLNQHKESYTHPSSTRTKPWSFNDSLLTPQFRCQSSVFYWSYAMFA